MQDGDRDGVFSKGSFRAQRFMIPRHSATVLTPGDPMYHL